MLQLSWKSEQNNAQNGIEARLFDGKCAIKSSLHWNATTIGRCPWAWTCHQTNWLSP